MKLAYFSPLPPQKSGISFYSEALLPHLSEFFDIDLWVSGDNPDYSLSKKYRIIDYKKSKTRINELKQYEYIIYNIGNNPEFHAEMYDVFLQYPGFVILHDFVLFFLITGYFLEYKKDREAYIREFYYNYGSDGIKDVKKIFRSKIPPLQFKTPEKYPMIKKIVQNATGIIVHSESTKNALISIGYPAEKIAKINQVNYSNMNFNFSQKQCEKMRARYGIAPDVLLITSLGYIAPTKRNAETISVINKLISSMQVPVQYLMVGEGNYIDGLLNDNIKKTGFVSGNDYQQLLCSSDIVINLRNPSMGESSATVLQAMTAGKPCVVTDIAWFSEIPDDAIIKISRDPTKEKQDLENAIVTLITNPEVRSEISRQGTEYVLKNHNPKIIAGKIFDFLTLNLDTRTTDFHTIYSILNSKRISQFFPPENSFNLLRRYQQNNAIRLRELGLCKSEEQGFFQYIKKYLFRKKRPYKISTVVFFWQNAERPSIRTFWKSFFPRSAHHKQEMQ